VISFLFCPNCISCHLSFINSDSTARSAGGKSGLMIKPLGRICLLFLADENQFFEPEILPK